MQNKGLIVFKLNVGLNWYTKDKGRLSYMYLKVNHIVSLLEVKTSGVLHILQP